jgi:chitin disaccharide deacetylase
MVGLVRVMPNIRFNADDFGASHAHNIAIQEAYQAGALNAASLMVGETCAVAAIGIARLYKMPVGLHLALSDAIPVLPPEVIPLLVRSDGRFYDDESAVWRAGASRAGRHQLRAEITAQFAQFHHSGLVCDHINSHRHSHLLPHVAWMLSAEAARWGVVQSRLPLVVRRAGRLQHTARQLRFHSINQIMRRSGINRIYHAIWQDWDANRLLSVLKTFPRAGLFEIYFHPVAVPEHPFGGDLPALLDDRVLAQIRTLNVGRSQ